MAKLSSINKNNKRIKLSDRYFKKRAKLKKIVMNKKLTLGFVGHIKRDENLGYSKFIKQIAKENFLEIIKDNY